MKLIIDIPDEVHDWHVNGFPDEEDAVRLLDIVKNGTPLSESEDCVSRQAVLDIAKASKSNWIDNSVLFKRVNELPSVTPQYTDDRCKECKKDWTKCAKCPVMMKWIKEHKEEYFASPTGEEE